jgi:hypothetical protein
MATCFQTACLLSRSALVAGGKIFVLVQLDRFTSPLYNRRIGVLRVCIRPSEERVVWSMEIDNGCI